MSPPIERRAERLEPARGRRRADERAHAPAVGGQSLHEIGAHLAGGAGDQRAPHYSGSGSAAIFALTFPPSHCERDVGAGLHLAADHAERHRAEPRRERARLHLADLLAAHRDHRRALRRRLRLPRHEAAQMPVHVAAEVHARHDLLPDVAPLRVRDRVQRVEVRFLRDRRLVHVDPPLGTAGLDARDLPRVQPRRRGAEPEQPLPDVRERRRRDEELVALELELRRPHDPPPSPPAPRRARARTARARRASPAASRRERRHDPPRRRRRRRRCRGAPR